MDKVKKWFFDDEEEAEVEEMVEEEYEASSVTTEPKTSLFEEPKNLKTAEAVRALNANKDGHLVLFEPRSFNEAPEIAGYLKDKRAIVINLHRLQAEQRKKVIDFLSGVIYAIDGEIQKIGPKIFLCTPRNISVAGSIDLSDEEE